VDGGGGGAASISPAGSITTLPARTGHNVGAYSADTYTGAMALEFVFRWRHVRSSHQISSYVGFID